MKVYTKPLLTNFGTIKAITLGASGSHNSPTSPSGNDDLDIGSHTDPQNEDGGGL